MSKWFGANLTLVQHATREIQEAKKRHTKAVEAFCIDLVEYIPEFVLEWAKLAQRRKKMLLTDIPPFYTQKGQTTRFLLGAETLSDDDWQVVRERADAFLKEQEDLRWKWVEIDCLQLIWA